MLLFLLGFVAFTEAQTTHYTYGAYFVNWAQYRTSPYTYTASNLAGIINRVDEIYYGFIYFCPPAGTSPMPYWSQPPYGNCNDNTEYQLLSVEPKDSSFLPTIVGYKSQNSNLKVLLSIGGWNFPSEYFSKLAASSTATQKFINSSISWLKQWNVDGIDIDWEYPCSPPRSDPVEISCTDFRTVNDAGGKCPDDTTNIVSLMKAIRAAFGTTYRLTIASQAGKQNEDEMNLPAVTPYIDRWHIMTYDYAVSDIPDASGAIMSPNCPLNNPPSPAVQMSLSDTVKNYIASGVPANMIMAGIPLYGHSWWNPDITGTDWQKFGGSGKIQGKCCGPFQETYGAQYGKGCNMCGTMMYSEIQAAKPTYYYDDGTQSAIGWWSSTGADGWTQAGTWVSYNDVKSVDAITQWAMDQGLNGVFIFDTSMDSVSGSTFTYEIMNSIADTLGDHGGGGGGNTCNPANCTVCTKCCQTFATQSDCDACVSQNCGGPVTNCTGKADGMYCVNNSTYLDCPQNIEQPCGPGTCCQQVGTSIQCGYCSFIRNLSSLLYSSLFP